LDGCPSQASRPIRVWRVARQQMSLVRTQIRRIQREEVRAQALQQVDGKVWNQIWDAVAGGIWDQMLIAEDIEAKL